MAPSPFACG